MMGGFQVLPSLKESFKPSEYNPKWAVIIVGPIVFLINVFWILVVKPLRKLRKKKSQ